MSGWPDLDRADDERLARSLAAGAPGALLQVLDRYAARLYDYCHALLRDGEQAADALHDTLIAAYAHVPVLREPDRLRGWLYALARNECMLRLRAPDRPAERHEAPEVEDGFLDEAALARRREARRLVHGALAGLRGREREVLDLRLRHGLDAAEIGGVLDLDEEEAAELARRAHARLEDALAAGHIARTGGDGCPGVAEIAADAGWPPPAETVRALVHHIDACPSCRARRERSVSAARLLNVLPVAMMPHDLRGHVLATATDPASAGDMAHIAQRAEPLDEWGWPRPAGRAPARGEPGRGGPRALWPVLAAAAAVVVVVAGAFFVLSGPPDGRSAAQGPPGGASETMLDPSSPAESEEPTESPTPTQSDTPAPTPTTATPTPSPTRPSRTPSRSPEPSPTPTQPRVGRLVVGSCTITGSGAGSCSLPVRAVGGTVTWSVTGASDGLSAAGGGTLRSGQIGSVHVRGVCTPPGGQGTVSFSTGARGQVLLACPTDEGDDNPDNGRE